MSLPFKLRAPSLTGSSPELLLAAAIAILALWQVGLMFCAMASTSLTTDEFGTIFSYSAKGPLHVMTNYDAAKNHVFFNLLNSVTPGRESIVPLRARLYSFVAAVALIVTIVLFAVRERRYLEGSLWLTIWGGSQPLLETSLLARGYGLLCLAAVLSCVCSIYHFKSAHLRWCIALGVITTIGTYAVPSYLFFGAPLLLTLWLADRRWPVFWIAAATAAVILLLYAPLLAQLLHTTASMAGRESGDFRSAEGVFRTLRIYGVGGTAWQSFLVYCGALLLTFSVPMECPVARSLRVLGLAVVAFFTILLFIETAPLRVASFAVLPLFFCAILAAGEILRKIPNRLPACLVAMAVAAWVGMQTSSAIQKFAYVPIENWHDAAEALDAAFPKTVAVDYGNHGKYLKYYLAPGRQVLQSTDGTLFRGSRIVVVDAHRIWADGGRSEARDFEAARESPSGVEIKVPGNIREIALNYSVPAGDALQPLQQTSKNGDCTGRFAVLAPAHSFVAIFDGRIDFARTSAALLPAHSGPAVPLKCLVVGNAVVVPLVGMPNGELSITVRGSPAPPLAAFLVPES